MADINVLMVGGRRAGKTSILAAMDKCCSKQLAGVEQLSIVRDEDSGIALGTKLTELKRYFSKAYLKRESFVADLNPSVDSNQYGVDVRVNERDLPYNLSFTDVPGEWFSAAEHEAEVQALMDSSQIIIIAIDTPHLVEKTDPATGCGKFHRAFNHVDEITRFFKTTFQKSQQPRLVLFVPLKCEKYYIRGNEGSKRWNMPMVTEMVQKGYEELISFLTESDIQETCTVAITPILTLGGAEFDKFDENGYAGIYRYTMDPKYDPQYCEQPLLMTLLYVIAMTKKKKSGKLDWLITLLKNEAKLKDLAACESTLKKLIVTDEKLGFTVLNDPMKMF